MVLPVVYTNVLSGIENLDENLNEMADIFEITPSAKYRYLIFPQVFPYFRSAVLLAIGLCFKAGIAAEVIGLPNLSIGEQLYQAKIFIDTPSLFAWTIVIAILSYSLEKLLVYALDFIESKMRKGIVL